MIGRLLPEEKSSIELVYQKNINYKDTNGNIY